ncbi:MAG: asparagine synthetase B [Candidatus Eiseniibacteriota bacterium]
MTRLPRRFATALGLALLFAVPASTLLARPADARILVPMDQAQTDHLKAYGLAFWALERGGRVDWLLNYRGGSFLMADDAAIDREARIRGIRTQAVSSAEEAAIFAEIEDNNMERVVLEKAPRIAVYVPPHVVPWDDAVRLALDYAQVPYTTLWDPEVIRGDLAKYDWLHLHHEDFTGQQGKFYAAYAGAEWYQTEKALQEKTARSLGFSKVSECKKAVARTIKDYVARGGFLFAMCSATDTYDIALAAEGVDIVDAPYDGDGPDPGAQRKLDFGRTLAFRNFSLRIDPYVYEFSDLDVTMEAVTRGRGSFFTLFDFSAKNDPVPSMLTQDHTNAVSEFLGQTTGFHKGFLKPGVTILAETEGTNEVKYIHGMFGKGTFTFLGGHDPEDYQHAVGDPATDLSLFKNSPGYRLILNNILFPAAEKKKQRT